MNLNSQAAQEANNLSRAEVGPSVHKKTRQSFIWIGIVPILLAIVALWSRSEFEKNLQMVKHTEDVLLQIEKSLSLLQGAETGQRGYLLTGDENYLLPYENAIKQIEPELDKLQALTADNPQQSILIGKLRTLAQEKLAELRLTIDTRRTKGSEEAIAIVKSNRGLRAMRAIRSTVAEIQSEESRLLLAREKKTDSTGQAVTVSFAAGLIATLLLLIWSSRMLYSYELTTAAAQQEVLALNADLERRVAERTLDLQRSNDDLQRFAYVASHDLQEPLRMVGSYLGLLARRYKGKLDDDADKYIHFAVDGAKRMQNLINDLLAYSRTGTQAIVRTEIEIQDVIEQAMLNLRMAIEESGARITVDPMPKLWIDETKFVQVFQNLLGNSIKFRKPDVAPEIHVAAQKEGNAWKFSISDNGIGFDARHTDRIFLLFQRLHGVGKYPGSGIGLSIMKRVVEGHGGEVSAISTPDVGSTFSFTIPVQKQ